MSARIFSLSEHRANVADPTLVQVEAYWDALRTGRVMPARADINPRGLSAVLSNCFILERISTRFARFRVYGRSVSTLAGTELREMPISALFTAESREIVGETIEQVLDNPAAVRLMLEMKGTFLRRSVQSHMTLLPLRDDLGSATRILGCVVSSDEPGDRHRQLDVTAKTVKPLEAGVSLALPSALLRKSDDEDAERGTVVQLPLDAE